MRIKNSHKVLTTEKIRQIVKFCKPPGLTKFDVMVKNSDRAFYGRSYYRGSGFHATADPFIVVRLGCKNKYPYKVDRERGKGYLSFTSFSLEELAVHIIAHELRHLWQYKHPRGYRVYGSRGQFSERDADAYAIHKVREWRRK